MKENKQGELFNNDGNCIWPTISHPLDRKFYLDSFKNHPEEWCRGNDKKPNVKHRIIFVLSSNDERGNTYCERQCFDCGKKITLGFSRIPTGIN